MYIQRKEINNGANRLHNLARLYGKIPPDFSVGLTGNDIGDNFGVVLDCSYAEYNTKQPYHRVPLFEVYGEGIKMALVLSKEKDRRIGKFKLVPNVEPCLWDLKTGDL